jgi:phosphatidylinositol alpha-1,6-mannosyltransferase
MPKKRDLYSDKELFDKLRIDATDRFVLFSVGRHVKRKGFEWFIREVMPRLDSNIIYLIGGIGKEIQKIHSAIEELDFQNRVYILGDLSEKELYSLYKNTDLFIMPNIPVKEDVEGFGIVVIEATSNGAFAIGANLEGIRDAIIEGKTGNLVAPRCSDNYVKLIHGYYRNRSMLEKIRKKSCYHTLRNYHWNRLAKRYITEIFEHEHE